MSGGKLVEENDTSGFKKAHNLSLTVGSGDSSDDGKEDPVYDMRSRMQSFAIGDAAMEMPASTIFVDDSDVILPSTSSGTFSQKMTQVVALSTPSCLDDSAGIDMENFVKGFFATDERILQANDETNFIEEIFEEKPPKIVRDYLFGHVIGEGSYSKVKEVLHTQTLIRRAVKIIKDKRLRKIPCGEQNVQHEIEVLKRVNHLNVVKLVELFRVEERQKLYIVMEFCVCSLQQMLDNCDEKMLPEFQAHLYFTQVFDGLDHLHAQGIIHKDIKPGNLLLSLEGIVKICDMGVAEILKNPEDDWYSISQGTPKFQPPEVVSGVQQKFKGRLVDIWACGVTLYNLVSGEYPFDGDVIMRLFESITSHPLNFPRTVELSNSIKTLISGILEKDPERRWNSEQIRKSEWFTEKHHIDPSRIVYVPAIRDIPAHRPLGVFRSLEQLFGQVDEFTEEGQTLQQVIHSTPRVSEERLLITGESSTVKPIMASSSIAVPITNNSNGNSRPGTSGHSYPPEQLEQYPKEEDAEVLGGRNRRNTRRKLSIGRLRQILFISMFALLILTTVLILWVML